jgi:hypothetical protein
MTLRGFVDEFATTETETTLSVVNSVQPPMVSRMLDSLFAAQPVSVSEVSRVLSESDVVQLRRDGSVVAESSFEDVRDAILSVNSDVYITGSRSLEDVETPDVVRDLEGTRFCVRGYPDGSKSKLLLIEISRYIESQAVRHGSGTLHAGFQRLSRIDDERGTARAYERLSTTDLDVHVYGAGDECPLDAPSATVHAENDEEIRKGWFVVFDPPSNTDATGASLLALSDGDGEWEGVWTLDTALTRRVGTYLEAKYGDASP